MQVPVVIPAILLQYQYLRYLVKYTVIFDFVHIIQLYFLGGCDYNMFSFSDILSTFRPTEKKMCVLQTRTQVHNEAFF